MIICACCLPVLENLIAQIAGKIIERQTVEQIVDHVLELSENTKFMVMAPLVRGRKGEHQKILDSMQQSWLQPECILMVRCAH